MPLEPVLQEIYKKGEELVSKISLEAQKEAEEILRAAKMEADEIIRKAREEAEKEAESLKKQELSSVSLEMKRMLLNKQKEIVEEVFELLRKKILELDEGTKKKLLTVLLQKNAKPGMLVFSNKSDEDVVKSLIKELNLDLEYSGNIECLGGVVLETANGEVRINLTFDEILDQIYEQKLSEVSKILFGESQ